MLWCKRKIYLFWNKIRHVNLKCVYQGFCERMEVTCVPPVRPLPTTVVRVSQVGSPVLNVSLVDWCAGIWLNVHISLLEKESSTGSMLLNTWGAIPAFSGIYRCHDFIQLRMWLTTMKKWYRTSQSGQSMRIISDSVSAWIAWFLSQNLLLSPGWRLEMTKTLDLAESFSN